MRSDFHLKNDTLNVDAFRLFAEQRNRREKSQFGKFPNFGKFQLYSIFEFPWKDILRSWMEKERLVLLIVRGSFRVVSGISIYYIKYKKIT